MKPRFYRSDPRIRPAHEVVAPRQIGRIAPTQYTRWRSASLRTLRDLLRQDVFDWDQLVQIRRSRPTLRNEVVMAQVRLLSNNARKRSSRS